MIANSCPMPPVTSALECEKCNKQYASPGSLRKHKTVCGLPKVRRACGMNYKQLQLARVNALSSPYISMRELEIGERYVVDSFKMVDTQHGPSILMLLLRGKEFFNVFLPKRYMDAFPVQDHQGYLFSNQKKKLKLQYLGVELIGTNGEMFLIKFCK